MKNAQKKIEINLLEYENMQILKKFSIFHLSMAKNNKINFLK